MERKEFSKDKFSVALRFHSDARSGGRMACREVLIEALMSVAICSKGTKETLPFTERRS